MKMLLTRNSFRWIHSLWTVAFCLFQCFHSSFFCDYTFGMAFSSSIKPNISHKTQYKVQSTRFECHSNCRGETFNSLSSWRLRRATLRLYECHPIRCAIIFSVCFRSGALFVIMFINVSLLLQNIASSRSIALICIADSMRHQPKSFNIT